MSRLVDEWFKELAWSPIDLIQHPTALPIPGDAYSLGSIARYWAVSKSSWLAFQFEKVRSVISAKNRKLRSPSGPLSRRLSDAPATLLLSRADPLNKR